MAEKRIFGVLSFRTPDVRRGDEGQSDQGRLYAGQEDRHRYQRADIPVKKSCNVPCTKVTLNPTNPLKKGATYVATVTTAAKDLAGNRMEGNKPSGNYVWSFKVQR